MGAFALPQPEFVILVLGRLAVFSDQLYGDPVLVWSRCRQHLVGGNKSDFSLTDVEFPDIPDLRGTACGQGTLLDHGAFGLLDAVFVILGRLPFFIRQFDFDPDADFEADVTDLAGFDGVGRWCVRRNRVVLLHLPVKIDGHLVVAA